MKLKEKINQMNRNIPAVFIAMKHKKTPLAAKILAAIAVGYALSPVDLIPDFIPVLGLLDDLLILPLLITAVIKLIPNDVFEECRREASNLWENGKPKKWYFALPIVFIWLLVAFLVAKAIWS